MLAGNGRSILFFLMVFLGAQIIQIYLAYVNRELLLEELSHTTVAMEQMRADITRTVSKAVQEINKAGVTCVETQETLVHVRDMLLAFTLNDIRLVPVKECKVLPDISKALGSGWQNNSKCVKSYEGIPPAETCATLKNRHFAIITIDSLRYDAVMRARSPWFDSFFKERNHTGWERRLGHATFSLPAHITILHGGSLGTRGYLQQHKDPDRMFGFLLNWMAGDWAQKTTPPRYVLPEASNLVKGFEKCGYETVGIGGVSWFNDIYETTDLWAREYFQQFYWREHFTPSSDDAFEYQITETKRLMEFRNNSRPLFYFLNIPSAHFPYRHVTSKGVQKQIDAFEYIDQNFQGLLDVLPRPLQLVVQADHGECFSDGCHGHGVAHPDVLDIPYFDILLEEGQGYSHFDPAKRRQPRIPYTVRERGEFFMWNI